jgi:CRISPR-associated protein Csm4
VKTYEVIIEPRSGFATPLKGDTLFGHFCWQAAGLPDLIDGGLHAALAAYGRRPFAVFSSAIPRLDAERGGYVLKRPDVPLGWLLDTNGLDRQARFERLRKFKHSKWMLVPGDLCIDIQGCRFIDDEELFEMGLCTPSAGAGIQAGAQTLLALSSQSHNTINRLSRSTGRGPFAPYTVDCFHYMPGTRLAVFVVIDEDFTDIERIIEGLRGIGRFGFGRDASTGKGRFAVLEWRQSAAPDFSTGACYTLAPCVPAAGAAERSFFTPFTRFGKHGDRLAVSRNPFKNPVVMADEGAVFFLDEQTMPFSACIGSAVGGVSKIQPDTVVQGYAPCLPINLEIAK